MPFKSRDLKIIDLYKNKKLSMAQIAEKLHVSFSVVQYALIKGNVARRSISEAITNVYITRFNKPGFKIKRDLSIVERRLQIAGIMLYWGEGGKRNSKVTFSNSDPEMIRVFLRFLREICGISESRLKAGLHIYPDHNESQLIGFWSSITAIPSSRFYKPFLHIGSKGTYKRKSLYGTLVLSYSDKSLLGQILAWIEEYKKETLPL